MKRKLRRPCLIVNPKAYIYGEESLELAKICDELAEKYDFDILFTAQHADIRMVAEATKHIIVTAQHMDGIVPGRGMGHILPESIKAAGAQAVVLNHAEHPLGTAALTKAVLRARELEMLVVICADTIVTLDGEILGKPADSEDAVRMLRELQGRSHAVFTGVTLALVRDGQILREESFAEKTEVHVAAMTEAEIRAYADSGEPLDKAGAYGIQGSFARYITGIDGDYSNVVGLPLCRLWHCLQDMMR